MNLGCMVGVEGKSDEFEVVLPPGMGVKIIKQWGGNQANLFGNINQSIEGRGRGNVFPKITVTIRNRQTL